MRTLSDTELADFQVIPKELFELTSDERRAVRDRLKVTAREKMRTPGCQVKLSTRLESLREKRLRVAYYTCKNGSVPINCTTAQPLIQPFVPLIPGAMHYGCHGCCCHI